MPDDARRHWIFDASPLIALGRAGHVDLLVALDVRTTVPQAVADEITAGRPDDPARRWLADRPPVRVVPVSIPPDVAVWRLGAGEQAVIALARESPGADAVLDERAARACALALGVRVRGTLSVLLLAKREGHLAAIRPAVDALLAAGYRLSGELVRVVLEEAGEACAALPHDDDAVAARGHREREPVRPDDRRGGVERVGRRVGERARHADVRGARPGVERDDDLGRRRGASKCV